jgi:hypothetical protein
MVAALRTGGAAACEAVRRSCDLSVLRAEEEPFAIAHHAAAVALAHAGAITALRLTLLAAEQEEHQKLIKAAVHALRAVRPACPCCPHDACAGCARPSAAREAAAHGVPPPAPSLTALRRRAGAECRQHRQRRGDGSPPCAAHQLPGAAVPN